jgi:hypothetical protein
MDVTTEAAAGGSEQTSVAIITAEGEGKLSLTDAARALASARKPKGQADSEQRAEGAAPAAEQAWGNGGKSHIGTGDCGA